MTDRTHQFERIRHLRRDAQPVIQRFEQDPQQWLPGPLDMTGAHEFAGTLRGLGLRVRYHYVLAEEWVREPTASRYIELDPRDATAPAITGEITITPHEPTGTRLTFSGEWHSPQSLLARPFGPLIARALTTAFTDAVAGNLTPPHGESD